MSQVSLSHFFLASCTSQKRSVKPRWSLRVLLTFSADWASTPPSFCFSPVFLSSLGRCDCSIVFQGSVSNQVTSLKCEQVIVEDARNNSSNKICANLWLLGSFEGLQHNPQPQLSFDTPCKKVLFTDHTPRTSPSRIVICCAMSDLSYLGVFSTGFFFMWDSPAFLPYTIIWYVLHGF